MSEVGIFDLSIELSSDINNCENEIYLENIIEIYDIVNCFRRKSI